MSGTWQSQKHVVFSLLLHLHITVLLKFLCPHADIKRALAPVISLNDTCRRVKLLAEDSR